MQLSLLHIHLEICKFDSLEIRVYLLKKLDSIDGYMKISQFIISSLQKKQMCQKKYTLHFITYGKFTQFILEETQNNLKYLLLGLKKERISGLILIINFLIFYLFEQKQIDKVTQRDELSKQANLACYASSVFILLQGYLTYFIICWVIYLLERLLAFLVAKQKKLWSCFFLDSICLTFVYYLQNKNLDTEGIFQTKALFQMLNVYISQTIFLFGYNFFHDETVDEFVSIFAFSSFIVCFISVLLLIPINLNYFQRTNDHLGPMFLKYSISIGANVFTNLGLILLANECTDYFKLYFIALILIDILPLYLMYRQNNTRFQMFQDIIENLWSILFINTFYFTFQSYKQINPIYKKFINSLSYFNTVTKFGFTVGYCICSSALHDTFTAIQNQSINKYIQLTIILITTLFSIIFLIQNFKELIFYVFRNKVMVIYKIPDFQSKSQYLIKNHRFLKNINIVFCYSYKNVTQDPLKVPLIRNNYGSSCSEYCKEVVCFIQGISLQMKNKVEITSYAITFPYCDCMTQELFSSLEFIHPSFERFLNLKQIFSNQQILLRQVLLERYFAGLINNSLTQELESNLSLFTSLKLRNVKEELFSIFVFLKKVKSILQFSPQYTLIDLYYD